MSNGGDDDDKWGIFREREPESKEASDSFDSGIVLPDTKSVLSDLEKAFLSELQREHREETKQEDKEGKSSTKKRREQKRGGIICMCMAEGCGIGPMIEKN